MIKDQDGTFLAKLCEICGYRDVKLIGDGFYAAIAPFMFTFGIIVGEVGDYDQYLDRWCYESYDDARSALAVWHGVGEPAGWHRHPASGRRRSDGHQFDEDGKLVPAGVIYRRP